VVANNTPSADGCHVEAPRKLQVSKSGRGSGTVTSRPAGIDCGPTCTAFFPNKTTVTLRATPNAGSAFVRWSGACSGTKATCTVVMNRARDVTATFKRR
jgi:hypothetical protein